MIVGNQRRNPAWNQRSGSSLVMALVVVLALVAVSASFLQVSSSITRRQMQAIDQKKAFYLAEAGLAESYVAIRVGKTGVIGSMGDPAIFGDGLFWVEVEEHENGLYTLRSTGMAGTARTVLSIVIEEGDTSVAALGLFSSLELTIPSGTLIDSYESGAGAYTPPATAIANLDLRALLTSGVEATRFRAIPRFPSQPVDVALLVPQATRVVDVSRFLGDIGGNLVRSVRLFEVYRGAGLPVDHKSLNFTVTLGADDRTLTTADEEEYLNKVRQRAGDVGAQLRG